jgi:hypothetical protein
LPPKTARTRFSNQFVEEESAPARLGVACHQTIVPTPNLAMKLARFCATGQIAPRGRHEMNSSPAPACAKSPIFSAISGNPATFDPLAPPVLKAAVPLQGLFVGSGPVA